MSRSRAARIFLTANGVCHLCGCQIRDGEQWEVSHDVALALGGTADDSNAKPAHVKCHKMRTHADRAAIAKRNRNVTAGYAGRPKRGFRSWRKFNGDLVMRDKQEKRQ